MQAIELLWKAKFNNTHRNQTSEFADGRSETSPDSEWIEPTVTKSQRRDSASEEQIQDQTKMKKFDIRKTFEIFLREPISVLTEGLFQLVNIENNIFSQKPYIGVDFVNKKTQITVVNNEKMYNLFQTVLFKRRLKEQKEKIANK